MDCATALSAATCPVEPKSPTYCPPSPAAVSVSLTLVAVAPHDTSADARVKPTNSRGVGSERRSVRACLRPVSTGRRQRQPRRNMVQVSKRLRSVPFEAAALSHCCSLFRRMFVKHLLLIVLNLVSFFSLHDIGLQAGSSRQPFRGQNQADG